MSENFDLVDNEEAPTSYSSSTPAAATNRPAIKAPGAGTGRRKEAVARVRLVPGTGIRLMKKQTVQHLRRLDSFHVMHVLLSARSTVLRRLVSVLNTQSVNSLLPKEFNWRFLAPMESVA